MGIDENKITARRLLEEVARDLENCAGVRDAAAALVRLDEARILVEEWTYEEAGRDINNNGVESFDKDLVKEMIRKQVDRCKSNNASI